MTNNHIIIGAGPAATNACETIRQFEADSKITLISDEPAHSRMALPYWLSGQIRREQTLTGDSAYFQRLNVDTVWGQRVSTIDPKQKTVSLSNGAKLPFDDLLIATGSSPISLPVPGIDLPGVQPLWSLGHTDQALVTTHGNAKPRVALVGAGFIGCIVLNAMYKRGWALTVIEREPQLLPRMLNAEAARIVSEWLESRHIEQHIGTELKRIDLDTSGSKRLTLGNGQTVDADLVIVATGVRPNLQLAKDAGLAIDHGVLVDDHMRTSEPSIYAAGDVTQGPVLFSGDRQVHAIQTTAVDQGRIAGANMAGQGISYNGSLLMNVLDVCGLQCASFGDWSNASSEAMTMSNPSQSIYRSLLWTDDQITGSIFVGKARDVGMLTDVGMVKGMMQTGTRFGKWQDYLRDNPFDIRRAFIALKVPEKLAATTLLGRPAVSRGFHFDTQAVRHTASSSHATYVGTR